MNWMYYPCIYVDYLIQRHYYMNFQDVIHTMKWNEIEIHLSTEIIVSKHSVLK